MIVLAPHPSSWYSPIPAPIPLPPTSEVPMTRTLTAALLLAALPAAASSDDVAPPPRAKVAVGTAAPAFKIKDPAGKEIDLSELTRKGPVLVRLTCGCSG